MPHQCTTCGHVFPDGSKEMLSGCPDCGGNKFQFHAGDIPADAGPTGAGSSSAAGADASPSGSPSDATGADGPADRSHLGRAVGKAATTVREFVADRARPERPEPAEGAPGRPDAGVERPPATEASPDGAADDDGPDPAETTQATLDALATDDEDADRDGATGANADPRDAAETPVATEADDADAVADRWPSVGTEDGVETDGRDEADEPGEWPDPWEASEEDASPAGKAATADPDDVIVAGETDAPTADAEAGVADRDDAPTADTAASAADASTAGTDESTDAGRDAETVTGPDAETVAGRDAEPTTGRDAEAVAGRDAEAIPSDVADENSAQADARTSMVGTDELPDRSGDRVAGEPEGDRPDLAELREELNDQFESIKVVAPGQYELNLMELYDREEYIIAIQENGRYVIEVPETIHGDAAE